MRGWRLTALLMCLIGTGVLRAQRTTGGGVSGHVFSAETNQPLRFATVQLQSAGQGRGGGGGSATTDLDGAFAMGSVPSGTYYVIGRMTGYVSPAVPDADSPAGAQTPPLVRVEDNQVAPVELRLERGGVLGGVVRFEDGTPAIGVDVRLLVRSAAAGGAAMWQPYVNRGGGGSGRTDDRGRYRLTGLPAGSYVVEASLPVNGSPMNGMFLRTGIGQRGPASTLRVYSGNVLRVKQATGVEVRGAEERTDADLQIPLTGLHTVRGTVDTATGGRSVGAGTARLLDPDDRSTVREAQIGYGGGFEMDYVPTGTYVLRVEARPERRESQQTPFAATEQTVVVEGDVSAAVSVQSATP